MNRFHPAFSSLSCDQNGLPELLHRLPDTRVMNYFRGLKTLTAERNYAAIQTTIDRANRYIASILEPKRISRPTNFRDVHAICNLGRQAGDLRHISLKILKQLVGAMKSTKPGAKRMLGDCPVDPALIEYVDSLEVVKAPQMRKEAKAYLGSRFGLAPEGFGYGDWRFSSPDRQIQLCLDFGGSHGQQLRYRLSHPMLGQLSFEIIWGIGVGDWDFIHRDNFEESMRALGDIYELFENLITEQDVDSGIE